MAGIFFKPDQSYNVLNSTKLSLYKSRQPQITLLYYLHLDKNVTFLLIQPLVLIHRHFHQSSLTLNRLLTFHLWYHTRAREVSFTPLYEQMRYPFQLLPSVSIVKKSTFEKFYFRLQCDLLRK